MLLWLRGFPDQGRRYAGHALALARELGDSASIIWALSTRAHFHLLLRERPPALEMADAAIVMGKETTFFYALFAARIVKGWALVQAASANDGVVRRDLSHPGEARAALESAVEVARKQGAKSLELRATTSLARLLDRQGDRREACGMLAEIYDWFTEGFDTADLKDAKALLDELSP
jgi:adenylate cyclase